MTEIPSRRLSDGDGANSKGVEDGGGYYYCFAALTLYLVFRFCKAH